MGGNEQKYTKRLTLIGLSMGLNLTIFEENLENYLGSACGGFKFDSSYSSWINSFRG
jgi:hypothetical protein